MEIKDYGELVALLNVSNLIVMILKAGIPLYILRRYTTISLPAVRDTFRASLLSYCIIMFFLILGPLVLYLVSKANSPEILILVPSLILFTLIYKVGSVFYQVDSKPLFYQTATQFLRPFIFILAIIALAYQEIEITDESALIVEVFIAVFIATLICKSFYVKIGKTKFNVIKIIFFNAMSLGVIAILFEMSTMIEVIIIDYLLTSVDVALYGYSQKMSGLADVAILAAITVYAPQLRKLFVDNNKEEIEKITRLVCRLVFSFTLVALLVFSVAGDVFLQMFLPDMIEAYGLTIYMIVSKLVVSVFSFSALVMMMIVEKRRLIAPGVVLAIVNIISCYFLVSIYGLYGGVASNFLSVFLLNLVALAMVKKHSGIRTFII